MRRLTFPGLNGRGGASSDTRGRWRATTCCALLASVSTFGFTVSAAYFGLCTVVDETCGALFLPFLDFLSGLRDGF